MIKFQFDGVNPAGKKVSGFLFAEDEGQARDKLKNNGYAILNIIHFQENAAVDDILSNFEFRGKNKQGGFVQGTIQANDPYQAYKKLRGEYELELEYILPTGLSLKEKNELKQAGIDPEIVALYEEEFKGNKAQKAKDKAASKEHVKVLSAKRQKKMNFYKQTIEQTIVDVNDILLKLSTQIDHNKLRELQDRVDTLSRLRSSNSIEHLDSLVQKLFRELRKVEVDENLGDELKRMLSTSVTTLSERFETGSKKLEIDISFIDADKIKKTLLDLRIIENISQTIFYFFFFLFAFCALGLLALLIQGLIVGEYSLLSFFWKSGLYVFVMSFSLFFSLVYFPLIFWAKKGSWSHKNIFVYLGISLFFWLVYIIEFPVFFFWI